MSNLRVLDIDLEIANRGIPVSWHGIYRRALAGSRPAAVKALCGECQGWEDGARQAIRDCPSVGCPLHAVRPFQRKAVNPTEIEDDREDEQESPVIGTFGRDTDQQLADVKAKILDHLHRHGTSARAYILFSTGIPESSWSEAIRSLLAEGEIEREGEKRSTRYRLKEASNVSQKS